MKSESPWTISSPRKRRWWWARAIMFPGNFRWRDCRPCWWVQASMSFP